MCRSSQQNCLDTYQKLILSSSSFNNIIQKGKVVQSKYTATGSDMEVKVSSDSRLLMIVLLLLIMQAMDKTKLIELMSSSSCLVRKVTHSLSKDSLGTLDIALRGIVFLLHTSSAANHCVHQLVDPTCIGKLIQLYQHEEDMVQSCVHRFLLELSHHLCTSSSSSSSSSISFHSGYKKALHLSGASSSMTMCASQLASNMLGHRDSRHREVGSDAGGITHTRNCLPYT